MRQLAAGSKTNGPGNHRSGTSLTQNPFPLTVQLCLRLIVYDPATQTVLHEEDLHTGSQF